MANESVRRGRQAVALGLGGTVTLFALAAFASSGQNSALAGVLNPDPSIAVAATHAPGQVLPVGDWPDETITAGATSNGGAVGAPANVTTEVLPVLNAGHSDNGKWIWPTQSHQITSPFGFRTDPMNATTAFHSGLDLGASCGAEVWAPRAGTVIFAGPAGGYGNRVVLDHGNGLTSSYNHLRSFSIQVGDKVSQRQTLALAGTTGRSTGCHLHFEIMIGGKFTDPLPFLTGHASAKPETFGNGNVGYSPIKGNGASASGTPSGAKPGDKPQPCTVDVANDQATAYGGDIPIGGPVTCTPVALPSTSPVPSASSASSSTTPSNTAPVPPTSGSPTSPAASSQAPSASPSATPLATSSPANPVAPASSPVQPGTPSSGGQADEQHDSPTGPASSPQQSSTTSSASTTPSQPSTTQDPAVSPS